jgi:hypothetical protein
MRACIKGLAISLVVILLCTLPLQSTASPIFVITISLEANVKDININESSLPLIINGSVGYDGYSVHGITIELEPDCDVGEVTLTQSEFIFHVPGEIPFTAYIFINPQTENGTMGTLTLGAHVNEGGISSSAGAVAQIFYVLNYDEGWKLEEEVEQQNEENHLPPLIITSYLLLSLIFVILVSRKTAKNRKRRT